MLIVLLIFRTHDTRYNARVKNPKAPAKSLILIKLGLINLGRTKLQQQAS